MSARDELKDLVRHALLASAPSDKYGLDAETEALLEAIPVADAILAAGYRKPRTITTVEELDALPVGSVVIHDEGWGFIVAERHVSDRLWYVTGCREYIRPEALIPATVLFEPDGEA